MEHAQDDRGGVGGRGPFRCSESQRLGKRVIGRPQGGCHEVESVLWPRDRQREGTRGQSSRRSAHIHQDIAKQCTHGATPVQRTARWDLSPLRCGSTGRQRPPAPTQHPCSSVGPVVCWPHPRVSELRIVLNICDGCGVCFPWENAAYSVEDPLLHMQPALRRVSLLCTAWPLRLFYV